MSSDKPSPEIETKEENCGNFQAKLQVRIAELEGVVSNLQKQLEVCYHFFPLMNINWYKNVIKFTLNKSK